MRQIRYQFDEKLICCPWLDSKNPNKWLNVYFLFHLCRRLAELLKYHKFDSVEMEAFSKVIKRMKELQFLFPDLESSGSSNEPASPLASRSPSLLSPPTSSIHSSLRSSSPHLSPRSSPIPDIREPKSTQWVSTSRNYQQQYNPSIIIDTFGVVHCLLQVLLSSSILDHKQYNTSVFAHISICYRTFIPVCPTTLVHRWFIPIPNIS